MPGVVIVDASVLLNILNVHQFNQDRSAVVAQLDEFMNAEAHLLLPLTAIFQTGDHIADLRDGRQRRRYAKRLRETVRNALSDKAPWDLAPLPDMRSLGEWMEIFPDHASRGPGLSDLSIIGIWERARERSPHRRVLIWSLDTHLQGYDSAP